MKKLIKIIVVLGAGISCQLPAADHTQHVPISITDLKNKNDLHLEDDKLILDDKELTSLEGVSDFPKLETLSLNNNNITTIPADTFKAVPKLRSLSLYSNCLVAVPTALSDTPNLQKLFLSNNRIPFVPANAFQMLTQLQELSLNLNNITSLDPAAFAGLVNLRTLNLERNNLQTLPVGAFSHLPDLHTLRLTCAHEHGSAEPLALPAGVFKGLTKLEILDLCENGLLTVPTDALADTPNLTRLDLSYNSIASIGPRAFAVLTKLKTLGLKYQISPTRRISTDDAAFEGLPETCDIQL